MSKKTKAMIGLLLFVVVVATSITVSSSMAGKNNKITTQAVDPSSKTNVQIIQDSFQTVIDRIVKNATDPAVVDKTYQILEIVPVAQSGETEFAKYCKRASEGFADEIFGSGYDHTLIQVTTMTVAELNAEPAMSDTYFEAYDLIYISNGNKALTTSVTTAEELNDIWSTVNDLSAASLSGLLKYATKDYRPLLIDKNIMTVLHGLKADSSTSDLYVGKLINDVLEPALGYKSNRVFQYETGDYQKLVDGIEASKQYNNYGQETKDYKILEVVPVSSDGKLADFVSSGNFGNSSLFRVPITDASHFTVETITVDEFNTKAASGTWDLSDYEFVFLADDKSNPFDNTRDYSGDSVSLVEEFMDGHGYIFYDSGLSSYGSVTTGGIADQGKSNIYALALAVMNTAGETNYNSVLPVYFTFDQVSGSSADAKKHQEEIKAIINNGSYRGTTSVSSDHYFTVLEIQPAYPFKNNKLPNNDAKYENPDYDFDLTKEYLAGVLGIPKDRILLDQMSSNAFISDNTDIITNYDLIYIGGNSKSRQTDTSKWVSTTRKDTMYQHVGDKRTGFSWDVVGGAYRFGNETVLAGNDITTVKLDQLKTYVDAGRPVIIDKRAVGDTTWSISEHIGQDTNVRKFLAYCKGKVNVNTGYDSSNPDSFKTTLVNTINNENTKVRPFLNVREKPIEYSSSSDTWRSNSHTFTITYDIGEELGKVGYKTRLYFDIDENGRFDEEEIYATDTYTAGTDTFKTLSYDLSEEYFGILAYRLEAVYTTDSGTEVKSSYDGYAGYDSDVAKKEKISVLQVVPVGSVNGTNQGAESNRTTLVLCAECQRKNGNIVLNMNSANTEIVENASHKHTFGIPKYVSNSNQGNLLTEFALNDKYEFDFKVITADQLNKYSNGASLNSRTYKGSDGKTYKLTKIDNPSDPYIYTYVAQDGSGKTRYWHDGFQGYYKEIPGSKDSDKIDLDFSLQCIESNERNLLEDFDMVVIGFGDCYGKKDFSPQACDDIENFVVNGGSMLCAHDTSSYRDRQSNTQNYMHPSGDQRSTINMTKRFRTIFGQNRFANDTIDFTLYGVNDAKKQQAWKAGTLDSYINRHSGNSQKNNGPYNPSVYKQNFGNLETKAVERVNDGIIARYPFNLDTRFNVARTHNQYLQLDMNDPEMTVWYTLAAKAGESASPYYAVDRFDGRENYYIYSKENVTYSGAGHSGVTPLYDNNMERKLFINTIFKALKKRNQTPRIKLFGDTVDTKDTDAKKDSNGNYIYKGEFNIGDKPELSLKVVDEFTDKVFKGQIYIDDDYTSHKNVSDDDKADVFKAGPEDYLYVDYDGVTNQFKNNKEEVVDSLVRVDTDKDLATMIEEYVKAHSVKDGDKIYLVFTVTDRPNIEDPTKVAEKNRPRTGCSVLELTISYETDADLFELN